MTENKNFNFKDFILKEEQTEALETGETVSVKKPAIRPAVEYSTEWCDSCDCIIKRATKTTEQFLVLLVSQGQYYIKNTKQQSIEPLTLENYVKFFADYPEEKYPIELNWTNTLPKGKKSNEYLTQNLNNKTFQDLAKRDLIFAKNEKPFLTPIHDANTESINNNLNLFVKLLKIVQDKKSIDHLKLKKSIFAEITGNYSYNRDLNEIVGGKYYGLFFATGNFRSSSLLEGTPLENRDYISGMDVLKYYFGESGVSTLAQMIADQMIIKTINPNYNYRYNDDYIHLNYCNVPDFNGSRNLTNDLLEILKIENFKFENFADYIVYESEKQGYGLDDFMKTLIDVINMQKMIYGKVKEKYPENLASLHQRLSKTIGILTYAKHLEEEAKKDGKASKRAEDLSQYLRDKESEEYCISVPTCILDILEEAENQSNCLASYVDAYVNGDTNLFFMRKRDEKDISLITIEIRDGKLRQAYGHHNTKPNSKEMSYIHKWCQSCGFNFTENYTPRAA